MALFQVVYVKSCISKSRWCHQSSLVISLSDCDWYPVALTQGYKRTAMSESTFVSFFSSQSTTIIDSSNEFTNFLGFGSGICGCCLWFSNWDNHFREDRNERWHDYSWWNGKDWYEGRRRGINYFVIKSSVNDTRRWKVDDHLEITSGIQLHRLLESTTTSLHLIPFQSLVFVWLVVNLK